MTSAHSATDLHDVEFNSSLNPPAGNHVLALSDPEIAKEYGLAPEDEGKIWGEGDQRILNAMDVLRSLKKEGKIKRIGFSGKSCHHDIVHPLKIESSSLPSAHSASTRPPHTTPCQGTRRHHPNILAPEPSKQRSIGLPLRIPYASRRPDGDECLPAQHGPVDDSGSTRLASCVTGA